MGQQKQSTKGNGEVNCQEIQVHFCLLQVDAVILRRAPNMDLIKKKSPWFSSMSPVAQKLIFPSSLEW